MVFHGYYFKTEKNGFTSHEGWQKKKEKENWYMLRQQGIQRKGAEN